MKARTIAIGFAAALALALPAATAGAEEPVVPPENSAATQYTEALPTAGGDKQAGGGKTTPAKALGANNAKRLESQGREGREVARVAAETAPVPSAGAEETATGEDEGGSTGGGSGGKGDGKSTAPHGSPKGTAHTARPDAPAAPPEPRTELPDGSSGLGEVVAEATGSSSSGDLGLLLPLAIAAAIAWSLAYLWRQRRPAE